MRSGGEDATTRHVRIGWIVVGSLVSGLVAAVFFAFAPFVTADENTFTGMILLGFAFGWALLAGLSTWLSDQPQRWAAAPAVFMALSGGIVLLGPDAFVDGPVSWVWPPALLLLVVWVFRRARRDLHSRTRPVLLYPILAVLVLFALGGGYERVGESVDAATSAAMHGQLVDVGQHRLHLDCTGSGSPTVVLEPGGGPCRRTWVGSRPPWRDTRVCVYDRPGRGGE